MNVAIYDATIAAWDSKYAYNRKRPSEANAVPRDRDPQPREPVLPSRARGDRRRRLRRPGLRLPRHRQRHLRPGRRGRPVPGARRCAVPERRAGWPRARAEGRGAGGRAREGRRLGCRLGWEDADGSRLLERHQPDRADGRDLEDLGARVGQPASAWTASRLRLGPEDGRACRDQGLPANAADEQRRLLLAVRRRRATTSTSSGTSRRPRRSRSIGWTTTRRGQPGRTPCRASPATTSTVACWDAKYAYWAIRPFQLDPDVKTLFPTPNHPSYPAAHGASRGRRPRRWATSSRATPSTSRRWARRRRSRGSGRGSTTEATSWRGWRWVGRSPRR